MRRRIFIAINLPDDIKNKIVEMQHEFSDLPVRFTKKKSLHLTIHFIGYVTDEEMLNTCRIVREIAKKHQPFVINFKKLCYGPPNKPPRLIWIEGERSEQLFGLKVAIENSLLVGAKDPRFFTKAEKQTSSLIPHITIARIRQMEWRKLPQKPAIEKEIDISVPVNSIEVMESGLKRNGAEYAVLEKVGLG